MSDRILETARSGMMQALQQIAKSAENVSRAFSSETEDIPLKDIVDIKVASHSYNANAMVFKAGEEMQKAVLDLLA